MTDNFARAEQSAVDCPRCSTPIAIVTIIGPTDGIAGPCGCRVSPTIFEDE